MTLCLKFLKILLWFQLTGPFFSHLYLGTQCPLGSLLNPWCISLLWRSALNFFEYFLPQSKQSTVPSGRTFNVAFVSLKGWVSDIKQPRKTKHMRQDLRVPKKLGCWPKLSPMNWFVCGFPDFPSDLRALVKCLLNLMKQKANSLFD